MASVMIVRQFLQWVRTAPAGLRAEATGALARAYLYSDLSEDDLAVAEGAMLMLLDDTSPLVRRALAEALCGSIEAPPAIIHALSNDQPDIAAIVLERSELFIDADLVEIVATGGVSRADRDRIALSVATLCRGRNRGSRTAGSLSDAHRKFRGRYCAVLDRPHCRASRASRSDPRSIVGARRYSGNDAAGRGCETVRSAGGFRHDARMARARPCTAHRQGSVRKGNHHDRGNCSRSKWCAHSSFARDGTIDRRIGAAGGVVGQYGPV